MIRCDFFVLGKKRTQCWPGFDTLVKIPQSKRANESAKLSALCAGKCEWPNRDWLWCRIWLGERFARVFQANTARGKAEPLPSLITFWASIKGALGGKFPAYYNPRSATSQVHAANQLPAILFRDVFPESVQKPFSIITSDISCLSEAKQLSICPRLGYSVQHYLIVFRRHIHRWHTQSHSTRLLLRHYDARPAETLISTDQYPRHNIQHWNEIQINMSLANMNGGGGEGGWLRIRKHLPAKELYSSILVSLALGISGFKFSTNNMDGNYHHIRGW